METNKDAAPENRDPQRSRGLGALTKRLSVSLLLIALGAVAAWAVITVTKPAKDPLAKTTSTFVTVGEGEVGAATTVNASAEWTKQPAGINRAAGVVTSVAVTDGTEVAPGSTLYSVGLNPVIIARGETPAFRDITEDTEGSDVVQLQSFLAEVGYYSASVTGKVNPATTQAIQRWQKDLGVPQTGTVNAGDIIYVPELPARVSLDTEKIYRGATLTGDESVLFTLPAAPTFKITVTKPQAAVITSGLSATIRTPEGATWEGITGGVIPSAEESEAVNILIGTADGSPVCGTECQTIAASGQTQLQAEITLVTKVSGLVVPSSAIITTASGKTAVINKNGKQVKVTIIQSANGMTVIEGVEAGTKVRVPGDDKESE